MVLAACYILFDSAAAEVWERRGRRGRGGLWSELCDLQRHVWCGLAWSHLKWLSGCWWCSVILWKLEVHLLDLVSVWCTRVAAAAAVYNIKWLAIYTGNKLHAPVTGFIRIQFLHPFVTSCGQCSILMISQYPPSKIESELIQGNPGTPCNNEETQFPHRHNISGKNMKSTFYSTPSLCVYVEFLEVWTFEVCFGRCVVLPFDELHGFPGTHHPLA